MINQQKAMEDAINALVRLNFGQLILFQRHVSEHVFNVFEGAALNEAKRNAAKEVEPSDRKPDSRPFDA